MLNSPADNLWTCFSNLFKIKISRLLASILKDLFHLAFTFEHACTNAIFLHIIQLLEGQYQLQAFSCSCPAHCVDVFSILYMHPMSTYLTSVY